MKREISSATMLSIVAPVHNERNILEQFISEIIEAVHKTGFPGKYEILLVNDGSTDGSGELLDSLATRFQGLKVIHLSRNFGQPVAVCAGLDHARGDVVILMDADLQDDPAAFSLFFQKWLDGCDVVYAVRSSRQESLFLRVAFRCFYRLLGWIAEIEMPLDAGTFSLMDRKVVDAFKKFPERNLYFPGLRAWAGFRQAGVDVPRRPRYDKKSRVGLRKMWKLSCNAIFSFSYVVLFAFRIIGVLSIAMALVILAVVLFMKYRMDRPVMEGSFQVMLITFFAGVNLLGISVIGEYVARIYDEVKARPRYIVSGFVESSSPGQGKD